MDSTNQIAIARHIAKKIAVEYIYGLEFGSDEQHLHLSILVPSPQRIKLTELVPFVQMAINDVSGITFKIYQTSEVRKLLNDGILYFLVACAKGNLLYQSADHSPMQEKSSAELIQILETAKCAFDIAKARVGSFDDGAKFYMEKHDFPIALFMLHQVCELNCRALEAALFGKEKRSHQLSEHHKFIAALLPAFNLLTEDHNNDLGRNLLNLFDKCYSAVRYENDFTAEGADIQLAYDIASRLSRSVDLIFDGFLSRLTSISEVDPTVEPPTTNLQPDAIAELSEKRCDEICEDKVLDAILEIIKEQLMPEAVYLFGKHSQNFSADTVFPNQSEVALQHLRFEILVISDVQNPYGLNFKNHFRQKFGSDVSVLLLIHGKKDFYRSASLENSFFNLVIRSGKLLFGDARHPETVDHVEIVQGSVCLELNLMNRNSRAKELWNCSGKVLDEGSMVLAASLMCQAVEQSCLGLIQKFLGYRPNMHRLAHLLDVCSVFWADTHHYFPKSIEMDKRTFSMLSNGQSLARHNDAELPAHNELWEIHRKVGAFIDAAKVLTEGKKE